MDKTNVQYGCGLSAPENWINFDASPTLRIQRIPILGKVLKNKLNTIFPSNVIYGDIVKGLPLKENSCDNIYCSHTLEHLSFSDCLQALKNTILVLKKTGIFRCIVPDLEMYARDYVSKVENKDSDAGNNFVKKLLMGKENRKRGFKNLMESQFGNSHHLWMWDKYSLKTQLEKVGFTEVRLCVFNDSKEPAFKDVEHPGRFIESIAFECIK